MSGGAVTSAGNPAYGVLGQPSLADTSFDSRCPGANARFGGNAAAADMFGPAGIAVDVNGRLYVTDYGGQRVLIWPDVDALAACQGADGVIGAGDLTGPEAVAVDPDSGTVFVADTLNHTVKGYRRDPAGTWTRAVRLGIEGSPGGDYGHLQFPRGLAVGADGRLYVADDFNNRVLIFAPPFADGDFAVDSIGAWGNGGFKHPKAVAAVGQSLFVADYDNDRVLRFTGPFDTPDNVYAATGEFTGMSKPVDLALHPDGSLLVTDQGNRRIARYVDAALSPSMATPSSSFSDHVSVEPLSVCADLSGRIYIADYRSYRVLVRYEALATAPVNASASAAAAALLADLHARPARAADRVAVGQYLIAWLKPDLPKSDLDGWYKDWLKLENAGLPLPKVMGAELSELDPGNPNPLNELIQHGQTAGNIVTLVWHPGHPGGGDFNKPVATTDLKDMAKPDAELGKSWRGELDKAAGILQAFKEAGVAVLFRPLHEQNGNFFWWGHDGSKGVALLERQVAWAAVWRAMVRTLTVDKGLDNLLFAFAANHVTWDAIAPPLTYYPGADLVDVAGIDAYNDELNLGGAARGLRHYAALVATGKPFGLTEFGQFYDGTGTGPGAASWDARAMAARVRDSYPRTAFAAAWYSSVQMGVSYVLALADVAHVKELLEDPLIDTQ